MAPVASNASAASARPEQAPLRIFYDRVAIALLGCLAVLSVVIGGVLALFSVVSGFLPLVGLLVAMGSFSALRGLAVRDRRAKLLARLETTRTRAMEKERTEVAAPERKNATVFDAQPGSNKRAPQLTVQELRAEALRMANNGAAIQRPEGWELTEIPLPQYVVANAAKRPAPAALETAAAPAASSGISLRASEAAARLSEATALTGAPAADASIAVAPAAIPAPAAAPAAPAGEKLSAAKTARAPRGEASGERINLDDVMQRRRA